MHPNASCRVQTKSLDHGEHREEKTTTTTLYSQIVSDVEKHRMPKEEEKQTEIEQTKY
jgi:hypothetical protein